MSIKNGFYFSIAVLLCPLLVYFVIDRVRFEVVSVDTTGTVESVTARNDRCGSRRRRHDCTKFSAAVRYEAGGSNYVIDVSAGSARGYYQPVSQSDYRVGQRESVAYDPGKPADAYRNTFWDIWGAPVGLFFLQICAFFGGVRDKRS